ncbi:hypothetical protein [Stutzerimonas kunmingensis]|uniref:hypothetical protein n=1 Tax=Stutzerimonas kunmingensis TaxID=1211807 RepID=UPI00241DC8C2|nr:hypothetical protein [Stutzerimonas kunmingensis]
MPQSIQHHPAQPPFSVIAIDIQAQLPSEGIFIDILVDATSQSLSHGLSVSEPPQGALALFFCGDQCTRAGIVNLSTGKPGLWDFQVATWPLAATVGLPSRYFERSEKRGRFTAKQCVSYLGKAQVDQGESACKVTRVPHDLAADLLARVGLEVPERLQRIYWSEEALERLRRERTELVRFVRAVEAELHEINLN